MNKNQFLIEIKIKDNLLVIESPVLFSYKGISHFILHSRLKTWLQLIGQRRDEKHLFFWILGNLY